MGLTSPESGAVSFRNIEAFRKYTTPDAKSKPILDRAQSTFSSARAARRMRGASLHIFDPQFEAMRAKAGRGRNFQGAAPFCKRLRARVTSNPFGADKVKEKGFSVYQVKT
jgi:hypothetical protein